MDWKWDKAFLSAKQLYLLEDKLEIRYLLEYGKKFELQIEKN